MIIILLMTENRLQIALFHVILDNYYVLDYNNGKESFVCGISLTSSQLSTELFLDCPKVMLFTHRASVVTDLRHVYNGEMTEFWSTYL